MKTFPGATDSFARYALLSENKPLEVRVANRRELLRPNNAKRAVKKAAKKFKPRTKGGDLAARKKKTISFVAFSKPRGRYGGRKPVEINIQEFEDLTASVMNCPLSELATMLGITPRTLKDKVKADVKLQEAYKRGKRRAKFALRAIQATSAMNGDSRMGIWLGKNYLGQSEPTSRHELIGNVELAIGVEALDARLAALIEREEKTVDLIEDDEGREVPLLPVPT